MLYFAHVHAHILNALCLQFSLGTFLLYVSMWSVCGRSQKHSIKVTLNYLSFSIYKCPSIHSLTKDTFNYTLKSSYKNKNVHSAQWFEQSACAIHSIAERLSPSSTLIPFVQATCLTAPAPSLEQFPARP